MIVKKIFIILSLVPLVMNTGKLAVALTVIYAGFIFYLSSQSDPSAALEKNEFIMQLYMAMKNSEFAFFAYPFYPLVKYPDKFIHMIIFLILGILLNASFRYNFRYNYPVNSFLALLVGFLYSVSDEFHQSFVPGRTASLWDLGADVVGLVLAQLVIGVVLIVKKKHDFT
ncbi:MAG: VanZ family protein [Archaeoglobaceae archaeon]